MEKEVKNFLFSSLENQMRQQVELMNLKKDIGKIMSITFILKAEKDKLDKTNTIQRIKFENHEGDSYLTDKQRNQLGGAVDVDCEKELKECKSIFVSLMFNTQTIHIVRNKINGEKVNNIV